MVGHVRAARPRAVTFSELSGLMCIPYDQPDSKAYSRQDQREFARAFAKDAARMSTELKDIPAGAVTPEQLCRCLGVDSFVTEDLVRFTREKRQMHNESVLEEQRRQALCGTPDIEKLARVSRKSSKWARCRAEKLAKGYAAIYTHEW